MLTMCAACSLYIISDCYIKTRNAMMLDLRASHAGGFGLGYHLQLLTLPN